MKAAAIADDLTGALEVGALLAGAGVRAWVTTDWRRGPERMTCDALVVDTETRSLDGVAAGMRAQATAAALRLAGATWFYKKTDSTLRGPIAHELHALTRDWAVVFAPAYPRLGRTVRNGVLLVNGEPVHRTMFAADPRDPVKESDIGRRLGKATRCEAIPDAAALRRRLDQGGGGTVLSCDAESDGDLAALAAVLRGRSGVVWAGSGGFAAHWAALAPGIRQPVVYTPPLRNPVLVCGSRHPASLRQAAAARALGIPVLTPPENAGGGPEEIVQALAARAAEAGGESLILFGGDTAFAVLEALGDRDLEAFGEALPGVPLSRTRSGRMVVTKAGGFGGDDLVAQLLKGNR